MVAFTEELYYQFKKYLLNIEPTKIECQVLFQLPEAAQLAMVAFVHHGQTAPPGDQGRRGGSRKAGSNGENRS